MSNSKERPLKVALVLAVVAVAALAFAGMATAAFTENPSINSSSAISDGATISVYDASAGNASTLIVNTNNSDTIDSVDAELSPADRNFTVYSADDTSDDYSVETGVNSGSDDAHTFNISHEELADVPVSANGSTDVHFNVTVTDDAGDTYEVNGTFTLDQANHERSVMALDQNAIDGQTTMDVTEENNTEATGYLGTFSFGYLGDEEQVNEYEVSDTRDIDGENTTVYLYLKDQNAADRFDERAQSGVAAGLSGAWDDPQAESGDRVFDLTTVYDDHGSALFYDSADSDILTVDNDTHVVYDSNEQALIWNLGSDYQGENTVDIEASTSNVFDKMTWSDIDSEAVDGLGFWDLRSVGASVGQAWNGFTVPMIGAFVGSMVALSGLLVARPEDIQ